MSAFSRLDHHRGRVALIDGDGDGDGRAVTYDEMLAAGATIGHAAARFGKRGLVVVVCRNDVDCVAGYVGLMRAGMAVLMLHHSLPAAHLDAIVARFFPGLLYAPAGLSPLGRPLAALGGYLLSDLGNAPPALHADLALLLTTSGTTGSRTLVRLSTANIVANAQSIGQYLEIGPDERAITTLPLSYSYGLSVLHSHLLRGASVVLTEDGVVSPGFWRAMRDQRVTSLAGVPFVYDMLKKLRFARMPLPALRTLTQAGGRMAPEMVAEFAEICAATGRRLIVMYGQTEATARISWLPWPEARRRPDSIGKAIPGGRLWLEDDDGNPVTRPGTVAELVYGGANVSLGTAETAADLGRGDDNGGILRTGDLAERDADGYFRVVGRRKRFLKLFGTRVNLDELEHLLAQAGVECACTGGDDHLVVHASAADAGTVKAAVAAHTGLGPQMFRVALLAAVPRQESGKVDYRALEADHG